MKKTILFFLMISGLNSVGFCQEIAVTKKGDTVVLYANGKWDYYDNYLGGEEEQIIIPFNEKQFAKAITSGKVVSGTDQIYEIWYDPKAWKRILPGDLNPDAENAFQLISGDAYAMLIFEKIQIPMETLSEIALENALIAAPDIVMKEREYRIINNDTMVCMRMEGSSSGMKISYYSYYYSNMNCSIQFHTFTGQNLFEEYKVLLEELLNGLVILKKGE